MPNANYHAINGQLYFTIYQIHTSLPSLQPPFSCVETTLLGVYHMLYDLQSGPQHHVVKYTQKLGHLVWPRTYMHISPWCDWHPCLDSVLSRYMCLYWSEWYLITSGSGLIHVHHPQRGVRLVHRTPFLSFLCTYTTHAGIATLRWVHCVCRWDYVRIRKRKCHGCG